MPAKYILIVKNKQKIKENKSYALEIKSSYSFSSIQIQNETLWFFKFNLKVNVFQFSPIIKITYVL